MTLHDAQPLGLLALFCLYFCTLAILPSTCLFFLFARQSEWKCQKFKNTANIEQTNFHKDAAKHKLVVLEVQTFQPRTSVYGAEKFAC